MLSRDSGLPQYTRNSMGTSGNVFDSPSAPERKYPSSPGVSMRHGKGLTIPTPRFSRNADAWNSTHRTAQGMLSRNCTSENSQNKITFQCWRVSFKTEVWRVHGSNEVEMAGSTDDLLMSQSIWRRVFFLIFEMLDARIASMQWKIISITSFRKRASVEEQRAQKYNRFLRGRQIAIESVGDFSINQSLWYSSRSYRICSILAYRMDDFQDFRFKMGSDLIGKRTWDTFGKRSWRFVQKQLQDSVLRCTTKNWVEKPVAPKLSNIEGVW